MEEPGLKTFGYSLSGGSDLDSNEYPDLLIGAYASDRAVSLRGRPVVNVTATLKVDPENINLEDKGCALTDGNQVPCVLVSICLQYTGIGVGKHLSKCLASGLVSAPSCVEFSFSSFRKCCEH